ncbi:MAG: phage holin family protein [Anaerolineae bacterium]|jgi:putative membrane protein
MNDNLAEEASSGRINLIVRQFNWRMVLVRVLVNGLSLLVTAAILPHVYLREWSLVNILLLGAILGILNAVVRPVLQFLTLSFIFVTFGLVVVMINTVILLLLAMFLPGRFGVDTLFWAMIAAVVMGILTGALESLLGLSYPILPDGARVSGRAIAHRAQPVAVPTQAESVAIGAGGTVGREEET